MNDIRVSGEYDPENQLQANMKEVIELCLEENPTLRNKFNSNRVSF